MRCDFCVSSVSAPTFRVNAHVPPPPLPAAPLPKMQPPPPLPKLPPPPATRARLLGAPTLGSLLLGAQTTATKMHKVAAAATGDVNYNGKTEQYQKTLNFLYIRKNQCFHYKM